ncbi:MAG: hypothetical protein U0W65_04575 [Bacteroidia bacterium]|nr:hypothetical protein [Bacteroidia bacterium]
MKILNIFKKNLKEKNPSSIQKLDKKLLEKVIGGADDSQAGKAHYGSSTAGKTA